jgi:hypothetical protein
MNRCPKCNSARVHVVMDSGKCVDCGHWWGENLCIGMDVEAAFINLFGEGWNK